MIDREVVITHLDDLRLFADITVHPVVSPDNWEVYSSLCDYIDQIKTEVDMLLKQQGPIKPILKCEWTDKLYNDYECPVCGNNICYEQKYCSECGRPVKWDD